LREDAYDVVVALYCLVQALGRISVLQHGYMLALEGEEKA
jgi:hypothetical protein